MKILPDEVDSSSSPLPGVLLTKVYELETTSKISGLHLVYMDQHHMRTSTQCTQKEARAMTTSSRHPKTWQTVDEYTILISLAVSVG